MKEYQRFQIKLISASYLFLLSNNILKKVSPLEFYFSRNILSIKVEVGKTGDLWKGQEVMNSRYDSYLVMYDKK